MYLSCPPISSPFVASLLMGKNPIPSPYPSFNSSLIGDLKEVWSKVVKKTSVEIIKKLAVLLHIDYRVKPMKYTY